MKYEIIGKTLPAVEIKLNSGESVYNQSGSMAWMSQDIKMDTNTKGGILKGIGRLFAGETLFMNTFTANKDNQVVAFTSNFPGVIIPINLNSGDNGLIIQKGAFLCAEPSIKLNITLSKKLSAGLFGGEGFILQEVSGTGTLFLEVDGDEIVKELKENETIKIDTGNIVAFDKSVKYEVEVVKGVKNVLFGGEGLFLAKLTGPGKVILQTQNFYDFASDIISLIPESNSEE